MSGFDGRNSDKHLFQLRTIEEDELVWEKEVRNYHCTSTWKRSRVCSFQLAVQGTCFTWFSHSPSFVMVVEEEDEPHRK